MQVTTEPTLFALPSCMGAMHGCLWKTKDLLQYFGADTAHICHSIPCFIFTTVTKTEGMRE